MESSQIKASTCLALLLSVSFIGAAKAEESNPQVRANHLANTLCITCHGTEGVSVIENYPSLAGQKAAYLSKQMVAFRDGTRKDAIMPNMVASFDDTLIKALAEHYSAQEQP